MGEGIDGRPVLAGLAGLGSRAGTVAPAVVGRGIGAAAVVVAEFNDDYVARDDEFLDLGEAALDGVGAGGAAAYGFVDYGDGDVFGEVLAPAWAY